MSRALGSLVLLGLSVLVAYSLFVQFRQGWLSLQFWEVMAEALKQGANSDFRIGRFDPQSGQVEVTQGPDLAEIGRKLWILRSQMAVDLAAMLGLLLLNAGRFVSQRGQNMAPSAYLSKSLLAGLFLLPLPTTGIGIMLILQAGGFDELGVFLMGTPLILLVAYASSRRSHGG